MATVNAVNSATLTSPLAGQKPNPFFNVLAGVVVVVGIIYAGYHLADDFSVVRDTRIFPFVLLGIALFIALGFEFVNGFHDTANAVATVIYTHSLAAQPGRGLVRLSSTFSGCSCRAARSPSASCRCCPSNSFCRSGAAPASPWCSRC